MESINEFLAEFSYENLENDMNFTFENSLEKAVHLEYNENNLKLCVQCMDYTTLSQNDTEESVKSFISNLLKICKDKSLKVAAVCVFPRFTSIASSLKNHGISTAVVCGGFPFSQTLTDIKVAECKKTVELGAEEIDVVISVGDMLRGNYDVVYNELLAMREACANVKMKVILETGELKSIENIFKASIIAIKAGADFIKTSTGKVPINATPEAVYVMCQAIKQYHQKTGRNIGIKIAGGVSKSNIAIKYLTIVKTCLGNEYLTPQLFRIGASHLMDDLLAQMEILHGA